MKNVLVLILLLIAAVVRAADETFDSGGVKIRYVTAGAGEPVILVHGWMSDATMWGRDSNGNPKLNVDALPGFQVIALDCRGHGKSEKPHDAKQYGVEMAKDVVRLMDHLNLKRAHLVGYSMGAFIVGNVAATHPDRVISVIYGGQSPILEGRQASGGSETEVFAKTVEEGKDLGAYIIEVSPNDRPKPTPELASSLAKIMFFGKDVAALAAAGRSLGELKVKLSDLESARLPTLFIYGELESSATIQNIQDLQPKLPGSEVCVIPKANHVTALAKPAFGLALVQFLKAHRAMR